MCIITDEVDDVSNTTLFCSVNENKTRQFTVYSNTVHTTNKNAMILPVPHPTTLAFHDMTNYPSFFSDCDRCFTKKYISESFADGVSNFDYDDDCDDDDRLEIIDVGSYHISVAKSLAELCRVDTNVFSIDPALHDVLTTYYNDAHYGFIICVLQTGEMHKYQPLAYSHDIYEDKPFLPTLHYHGKKLNNTFADDWDHTIYLHNVTPTPTVRSMQHSRDEHCWKNGTTIFDHPFDLEPCHEFHKLVIHGRHPNIDLVCTM